MSLELSYFDILQTAKQKLGGVSSCLNDSKKFAEAVQDFDSWLEGHKAQLTHAAETDKTIRDTLADILRHLTRLELQARHNAQLVSDMQGYLRDDYPENPYKNQHISGVSPKV